MRAFNSFPIAVVKFLEPFGRPPVYRRRPSRGFVIVATKPATAGRSSGCDDNSRHAALNSAAVVSASNPFSDATSWREVSEDAEAAEARVGMSDIPGIISI
jgi:hypothetical protein